MPVTPRRLGDRARPVPQAVDPGERRGNSGAAGRKREMETGRREFLRLAGLGAIVASTSKIGTTQPGKQAASRGAELSRAVQMQFMRPGQVEAAGRRFPVAYVPLGSIEWHGRHLPLGTDALKAHAILVTCAEEFGGVVHPPIYFHAGFSQAHLVPLLTDLFGRLRDTGFRVIMGVSGHNVPEQITMVEAALAPVIADGSVAGIGVWEITLSSSDESGTDHAAKWETSDMMFCYPDLVEMSALGEGPVKLDMSAPDGIGGLDPRRHASAGVGKRSMELAARAIGRKAQELLASLPEGQRGFRSKGLTPEHWWMI